MSDRGAGRDGPHHPETGGAQATGSHSQIFTRSATLGGSLVLDIGTPSGLFEDHYSWDNLIDADERTGEFEGCGDVASGSPLLKVTCTYDGGANVDVELTRIAFDAVGGLNRNGQSVAAGLEATYDPAHPDRRAPAYAALFRVDGSAAYNDALNQLSGSAYANYLQSFASLGGFIGSAGRLAFNAWAVCQNRSRSGWRNVTNAPPAYSRPWSVSRAKSATGALSPRSVPITVSSSSQKHLAFSHAFDGPER